MHGSYFTVGTARAATMECLSVISLCFLLCLCIQSVSSQNTPTKSLNNAIIPPRGWNSYDSFSWIVPEEEYLQNADIISKRLRVHGYQYAVVDYLWYRTRNGSSDSIGCDVIDEWGRMLPDPERWPSSRGGRGFSEVADKVHSMGLKFGIHLMAGISTQAFNKNTPILDTTTEKAYEESGRVWYAKDIGIQARACKWMPHGFMGINATIGAGKAFLRSIYELYASWGVDFVKLDCVFGADLDMNEITSVSQILKDLNRPIVFSVSPGVGVTPDMAKKVNGLVNMYRVTGDDWDTWPDVVAHFNVSRDFAAAKLIGVQGLMGKSWPDLDMLPFGWLTDAGVNEGPHRFSRLNQEEQRTQMTLWSMAKSPIMYGGDLRKLDMWTYGLITNPILLEINSFSSNNMEFPNITSSKNFTVEGQDLGKVPSTHSLVLTGCTDPKARGWSSEKTSQHLQRICYKQNSKKDQEPFCVHKRQLPTASSDEESMYKRKHHLADINRKQFCLDVYPKGKLTAQEVERENSFSPCRFEASQMWELKSNGTLVNGHSSMCATVESVQAKGYIEGIRSWVASGRKGETYVAFFNLNSENTTISAEISDLGTFLPGRKLGSCRGKEIWSGKTILTKGTLLAEVVGHGCALFVLKCK